VEGLTLGSYTVERELGRGGMGAVYSAVHTLLGRRAAVKVLLAELSRNQDLVQRFFNEARAATAIKHPSIVEIYDFGWAPDGSAYIVMELMEGESLATRLARQRRLPVAVALTVARQIANALAAAHRAGIVHRDLKPDNVFLVADVEVVGGERVKLLDFGIAKLAATGGVSRTTTGAIMGTPLYMSPEQCEGARHVDHRTDLYALGCILFEMIAGRPPFQSEGVGGLIGAHLHLPPPALRSVADAPVEVEAIVARLLAKSPDDRYPRAEDVAAALGQLGGATTAPGVAASPSAFAPVAPSSSPASSSALSPSGLASVPPPASLAVAATAPSTPPPVAVGVAATAASAPPPTTLSGSSGALPHTPAPWSPPAPMTPRPRRGRWLALGGVVVVVGAAIAVAAVTGGGGAAGTATPAAADAADLVVTADALAPLTAADADAGTVVVDPGLDAAAVVVVADVDAAGADAGQALAEMQRARADRDWARLRLALDALYDATTDGDPRRAQADDMIAEARPQAIAEARKAIEAASRRGACADATRIARDTIAAWGEDAAALKKLAARCSAAHSGDERVAVDAGVGPPIIPELPPAQIAGRLRAEAGRMRPCMAGANGPVRLALRIDIRPDGSVQGIEASPDDDRATCVERVVKTMRFQASVRGASAVVPFVVTPPPKPPPPTTGPIEGPPSPALKY